MKKTVMIFSIIALSALMMSLGSCTKNGYCDTCGNGPQGVGSGPQQLPPPPPPRFTYTQVVQKFAITSCPSTIASITITGYNGIYIAGCNSWNFYNAWITPWEYSKGPLYVSVQFMVEDQTGKPDGFLIIGL